MKKKYCYILIGLMLLVTGSCSKEESAPAGPTIEELLVSTSWKLQKIQIQIPPDPGLTDNPNLGLDPCEADDSYRFSTDNLFVVQDGANACNGNGRSVFWNVNAGKWTFTASDSTLIITGFPMDQKFKIKSISPSTIVMYQSAMDILGQEIRYLFTLTAKK